MDNKFLENSGLTYLWSKLKEKLAGKQDLLTGKSGQVVGFDADGRAVAQDAGGGGVKAYRHVFSASDWTGSSELTMTIPAATHGVTGEDVLCKVSVLSGSSYVQGTWAAQGTYATIDAASHIITLHTNTAFAGAALLVG